MECNKEEAVRAIGIAEEKLRRNDYAAARRIALRALKLDSELENVDKICAVCDVHCAAENKLNSKGVDWYGILQVGRTNDESMIKKQYHKLALLLHPDKNKYAGAEAAFKLIGEAKRVLLDCYRCPLGDLVNANSGPTSNVSADFSNEKFSGAKNPPASNNVKGDVKKRQPLLRKESQTKGRKKSADRVSFWTDCTVCGYRNDFIVGEIGKPFMCHSCDKSFIPYTMSVGTRSCNKPTTPDMIRNTDPKIWYEIFGFDETKVKGSRKRGAGGACKASVKKQCKTSNK